MGKGMAMEEEDWWGSTFVRGELVHFLWLDALPVAN